MMKEIFKKMKTNLIIYAEKLNLKETWMSKLKRTHTSFQKIKLTKISLDLKSIGLESQLKRTTNMCSNTKVQNNAAKLKSKTTTNALKSKKINLLNSKTQS